MSETFSRSRIQFNQKKDLNKIIKLSAGVDGLSHLLVQATKDHANAGVFTIGKKGPTKNVMLVDDNQLKCVCKHLQPFLKCDAEAL